MGKEKRGKRETGEKRKKKRLRGNKCEKRKRKQIKIKNKRGKKGGRKEKKEKREKGKRRKRSARRPAAIPQASGGRPDSGTRGENTGQIPEGGLTTRTVSLGRVFREGSSLVVTSGRAPEGRTENRRCLDDDRNNCLDIFNFQNNVTI